MEATEWFLSCRGHTEIKTEHQNEEEVTLNMVAWLFVSEGSEYFKSC